MPLLTFLAVVVLGYILLAILLKKRVQYVHWLALGGLLGACCGLLAAIAYYHLAPGYYAFAFCMWGRESLLEPALWAGMLEGAGLGTLVMLGLLLRQGSRSRHKRFIKSATGITAGMLALSLVGGMVGVCCYGTLVLLLNPGSGTFETRAEWEWFVVSTSFVGGSIWGWYLGAVLYLGFGLWWRLSIRSQPKLPRKKAECMNH